MIYRKCKHCGRHRPISPCCGRTQTFMFFMHFMVKSAAARREQGSRPAKRHAILALHVVLPHVRDAADSLLAQRCQQQAAALSASKKKFAARTARQVECRPELRSGEMKKAPVYKTGRKRR